MATIKSFTSLEQSKKLAEILTMESADMYYEEVCNLPKAIVGSYILHNQCMEDKDYKKLSNSVLSPAWSLAALLECMNRNFYKISLNYCGSEYTISFDDGEKYKTITKDYSIDAAFEMICWLKENDKL